MAARLAAWIQLGIAAAMPPVVADDQTQTLLILLYNEASVDPDVLSRAEQEASAVLRQAGISTRWIACGSGNDHEECRRAGAPDVLRLRIFPTSKVSIWKVDQHAFGFALSSAEPPFGTLAGVLYDRVQQIASGRESLLGKVLGCVFAHEIGHLLLNGGGHATAGLMKAHWTKKELNLIDQRVFLFHRAQARRMVRAIEARHSLQIQYARASATTW